MEQPLADLPPVLQVHELELLAERSSARIHENELPDRSGWPQYFPQQAGDTAGLCGTCYSVLAIVEAARILEEAPTLEHFSSRRILETLDSKRDETGGFIVDTHWPVSTIDACWEAILTYRALGESSHSRRVRSAMSYVLSAQRLDGGWPYAITLDASEAFPTTQMLYLLSSFEPPAEMREASSKAQQMAVDYLLRQQADNGSWQNRPAITARALDALHTAGVPDHLLSSGAEWLEDAAVSGISDEFDCIDIRGKLTACLTQERVLRYSHTARALVVSALIGAGRITATEGLISTIVQEGRHGGFWRDSFSRCDLPDGRIGWFSSTYNTAGGSYDAAAASRYAVWPIYFNLKAIADYLTAFRARAGDSVPKSSQS